MTNPSNRYENLTPTRFEKTHSVTDSEINEALERDGVVEESGLADREVLHDDGTPPADDQ
ncbi:hypothetical protein [Kribbella sp. DT2]|uniref:hypothetical protein n=1 Tax=Kribbella sp. DT2 TaxID=3393427 RepID=UPI003CF6605C